MDESSKLFLYKNLEPSLERTSIYRLMIFQSGVFLQNFVSVTTVLK